MKYRFRPVYKINKEWITPFYFEKKDKDSALTKKAIPIEFSNDLIYNFKEKKTDSELSKIFPKPYFSVKDGIVRTLYGYKIEDVFEFMKNKKFKDYYGYNLDENKR